MIDRFKNSGIARPSGANIYNFHTKQKHSETPGLQDSSTPVLLHGAQRVWSDPFRTFSDCLLYCKSRRKKISGDSRILGLQAGGPLSGQGWRRRERSVSGASTERHRRYVGTAIAGPAATPGRNQRPVKKGVPPCGTPLSPAAAGGAAGVAGLRAVTLEGRPCGGGRLRKGRSVVAGPTAAAGALGARQRVLIWTAACASRR